MRGNIKNNFKPLVLHPLLNDPIQLPTTPSRAPEAVVNDAIGEIKSLEAAIELLGPTSVHAKPLLTALKAAQGRSKVGPIRERLDSCRQFIERAKKCVLHADKAIFEAEVAQAEQRLILLQAEVTATTPAAVVPEPAQVKELQTQIDFLVRERDALKSNTSLACWWRRRECHMDGKRSSMRGEHSTDAHVRSAGSGKLDVRPQLRPPERHGVRRFIIDLEDWRWGKGLGSSRF